MNCLKRMNWKLISAIAAVLMLVPLFLFRTVHGQVDFPETCACLSVILLYLLIARLISRLHLTSVLISVVIFSAAVFGLALLFQPGAGDAAPPVQAEEEEALQNDFTSSLESEEGYPDSSRTDIHSRIDSLATSGGRAIRNVGLFDGSGTVGMTLGAVGEVTSATAEIFIRTVYAGSNVAREDSIVLSENVLRESSHPLRVLALLAAVILTIAVVACLRYLILVERKKRTLFWFRFLAVLLALRVVYVSLGFEDLIRTVISDWEADAFLAISPLYVLIFAIAFVNALRTEWLHYLNRWRKYLALAGALGVIVLSQSILRIYFEGGLTVCSLALGTLIGSVFTILFIFGSVAFLKILFLLPSARIVDRRLNQLKIMDGLGQSIYSTFDENRIIASSVTLGRKLSGADVCWAVKVDDGSICRWKTQSEKNGEMAYPEEWHRGVLERLEKSNGTLLYNRYPNTTLARLAGPGAPVPGSLIASYLKIRKKTFGILYASTERQFGFMSESKALVETFARQVAAGVDNARLMETELERQRYLEELAIARSIQESLLPGEMPEIRNMEIAGMSVPSRDVGGDYYDVFPISEGLYGITIADVAGKGTAAALLMAALQAALHAIAPGMQKNAGETVEMLNRVMSERMPDDKFVTFFYGVLDTSERTIHYCCAGHDPPVLRKSDGNVQRLSEGGLILGINGEAVYRTDSVKLKDDDSLLLFTDGITETMRGDSEEEFGVERLVEFLLEQEDLQTKAVLENLLERLEVFRGQPSALDDMTLLMITCTG